MENEFIHCGNEGLMRARGTAEDEECSQTKMKREFEARWSRMEDQLMARFRILSDTTWSHLIAHVESSQPDLSLTERSMMNLLEEKMQRMERLFCDMEDMLEVMERRVRKLESRVEARAGISQVSAAGASTGEQCGSLDAGSERAVALDVYSAATNVSEDLSARITALESSVQKVVSERFPKLDLLLEQLEVGPWRDAVQLNFIKSPPADASAVPKNIPSFVPVLGVSNLDRQLMIKAARGDFKKVLFLLNVGAEPNAADGTGYTPLHLAARRGHADIVELLIARGAHVDGQLTYTTPLQLAALHGHCSCVEVLIRKRANIEAKSRNNWTPLHFACNASKERSVQLLLRAGADCAARANDGKIPRDLVTCPSLREIFSHCPEYCDHNSSEACSD